MSERRHVAQAGAGLEARTQRNQRVRKRPDVATQAHRKNEAKREADRQHAAQAHDLRCRQAGRDQLDDRVVKNLKSHPDQHGQDASGRGVDGGGSRGEGGAEGGHTCGDAGRSR